MNAFMTTGTYDFLKKLEEKHSEIPFYFMKNPNSTLAYYESNGKSIFAAGRTYEILIKKGNIKKKGYVVMNNIPVSDEGKPVFEDRFMKQQQNLDQMSGLQAFRLLKPLKGNTYIVFTQWATEGDYILWKESEHFQKSHGHQTAKPPAYFLDRPFITEYVMVKEDDHEQ